MLVKRLKTRSKKQDKPAARTLLRKPKILKPEFTPDEVVSFELQAARHQQSESAWQRLAALPEGEDRWAELEEHLLYKTQADQHAERRWKYFAK